MAILMAALLAFPVFAQNATTKANLASFMDSLVANQYE